MHVLRRLTRLLPVLKREAWRRTIPHGLVGLPYLWAAPESPPGRHRHFWWTSGARWPRPLWLLIETWLWLRWMAWYGPIASLRAVRRLGPALKAAQGIPLGRQTWITLRLALGWCIPPRDIYRFQLHQQPWRALDYVYDHEVNGYHAWRCRPQGPRLESLHGLQDKQALAERLAGDDIPVATTLQIVAASHPTPLPTPSGNCPALFCKTRSGNQGRGAFAVWRTEAGLAGRSFTGTPLDTPAQLEAAWQALLALDDVLVQPLLRNHPDLAPLAPAGEAITVRYISTRQDGVAACQGAMLEIPLAPPAYCILPIAPETGIPQPPPAHLPVPWQQQASTCLATLAPARPLPGWTELVAASHRAHAHFPDLHAIAWDWVITPKGPVMLEGNFGWGTGPLQMLQGPCLCTPARRSYPDAPRYTQLAPAPQNQGNEETNK